MYCYVDCVYCHILFNEFAIRNEKFERWKEKVEHISWTRKLIITSFVSSNESKITNQNRKLQKRIKNKNNKENYSLSFFFSSSNDFKNYNMF